jgi:hypothetical protein
VNIRYSTGMLLSDNNNNDIIHMFYFVVFCCVVIMIDDGARLKNEADAKVRRAEGRSINL